VKLSQTTNYACLNLSLTFVFNHLFSFQAANIQIESQKSFDTSIDTAQPSKMFKKIICFFLVLAAIAAAMDPIWPQVIERLGGAEAANCERRALNGTARKLLSRSFDHLFKEAILTYRPYRASAIGELKVYFNPPQRFKTSHKRSFLGELENGWKCQLREFLLSNQHGEWPDKRLMLELSEEFRSFVAGMFRKH